MSRRKEDIVVVNIFLRSRGDSSVSGHVAARWEEPSNSHSFLSQSHWIVGPKIALQRV